MTEKTMPTISDASEEDVQAIIAIHAQSWLDTYPNEGAGVSREWIQNRVKAWGENPEKVAKRIERIKQAKNNPDVMYRIAKDEKGQIVGLSTVFRDETKQSIDGLYIDRDYYGTGLAQRLMDEIIDWADPARLLELEVATYNERAKAFYRKYGFEEVEGSEYLYDVIPVVKMIRKVEQYSIEENEDEV